jgi:hypothetical protein
MLYGYGDVLEYVFYDRSGFFMSFVTGRARPYRKDSMSQARDSEPLDIARHQKISTVEKRVGSGRAQEANGAAGAHTHLESRLDTGSSYDGHHVPDERIVCLDPRHFVL